MTSLSLDKDQSEYTPCRSGGLVFSPTSVSVREGSTATYTVKLKNAPTGNVTVAVARKSGDTHDSDLSVSAGSSLTFTTGNYNTTQNVRLSAAEDVDGDAGTAVINHTVSSGDNNYNGIVTGLTATEIDNDPRGLTLSKTSVTVIEGSTETYTVQLKQSRVTM